MAPPFRVDTENPVEFDERQDLQGKLQNCPEARDSCPAPVVELDESGTSRDETAHRRHAASLHNSRICHHCDRHRKLSERRARRAGSSRGARRRASAGRARPRRLRPLHVRVHAHVHGSHDRAKAAGTGGSGKAGEAAAIGCITIHSIIPFIPFAASRGVACSPRRGQANHGSLPCAGRCEGVFHSSTGPARPLRTTDARSPGPVAVGVDPSSTYPRIHVSTYPMRHNAR